MFKIHAFFRVILCPFDRIAEYIPNDFNSILDFGCGHGIWLNYLKLLGKKGRSIGMDIDEAKIRIAKKTINKNIEFIRTDLTNLDPNKFDLITIIDTMYLLPVKKQQELLISCSRILNSGGCLLIKENEKSKNWKFYLNVIEEFVAVKILKITRGQGLFWQRKEEFMEMLRRADLSDILAKKIDGGYLHPHILYIGRKK
jgi:ubiquinone/menaquinone biosynthesis C-methylase UbiE